MGHFTNKTLLITGGTGSFGNVTSSWDSVIPIRIDQIKAGKPPL